MEQKKKLFPLNKKAVLVASVIAFLVVFQFFVSVLMIESYKKYMGFTCNCKGMDNFRYTKIEEGMTKEEIVSIYGDFDIELNPYSVGYRVSAIEAGYKTKHDVYLMLYFAKEGKDNEGELQMCRQEVFISER